MKIKTLIFHEWNIILWLIVLVSFPLFYFSYKYSIPDFGGEDYYAYQYLYSTWDFSKVPAPFNMRIISAFFIYLFTHAGFSYSTETVFGYFHPELNVDVFFNAIFFNYLCVVSTAMMLYFIIKKHFNDRIYAFLGSCAFLLSFGTLIFSLKPMSEACGVLLMVLAWNSYLKKNYWVLFFLFLSIFQREFILIAFAVIAGIHFLFDRNRYSLFTSIGSVMFFILYFILRKTFFFTPHFESQATMKGFGDALMNFSLDFIPFIKQTFFISNIFIIYLLLLLYKKSYKLNFNVPNLFSVLAVLFVVVFLCIAAKFGNNGGRYFYYIIPVLIFYVFDELFPLINPNIKKG